MVVPKALKNTFSMIYRNAFAILKRWEGQFYRFPAKLAVVFLIHYSIYVCLWKK